MRVLITGGFGFIGGRLAVHLAKVGHHLILGSRQALDRPYWLPQAQTVQTLWNDDAALESICRGVDLIIHAAGMNAQDCASDPVGALEFNGVATARLVAAACRVRVRKFIYVSTAHVYASPLEGHITEETYPRNLHPYATSHLAGEHALLSANERRDIHGIVLRLSNAFGEPAHEDVNCWSLLVNDLCRQAVQSGKLTLRSNGEQQRDFISLSEVNTAIGQFLDQSTESNTSGVFNVGSGRSVTVLSISKLIQHRCFNILGYEPELLIDREAEIEEASALEYESTRFAALGINFRTGNAEDGIDKLLNFCRKTFSAAGSRL